MDRHIARSERRRGTIDFESSRDYARRSYDQSRRPFQRSRSKTWCRGVEVTHDRCPSGKRTAAGMFARLTVTRFDLKII